MQRTKTKIVYNMQYAIELKLKGHQVITTMPNPKNDKLICWIFNRDQTFDSDLSDIINEGRKKHG